MNSIIQLVAKILVVPMVLMLNLAGYNLQPTTQNFGATASNAPALIDTYLASNIDASQTTLTLANGNDRAGVALSGNVCLTIDDNSPTVEYTCGVANGATITNLSRGVYFSNPTASSTALAFTHRRYAPVTVSDYPVVQQLVRMINGTDTLDHVLTYSSGVSVSSSADLANKGYVDAGLKQGVATSTEESVSSIPGAVVLGTGAQAAAGTASTTTGAPLVIKTGSATSTPGSNASNVIPVTGTNGKLNQGFLDLSQNFNFTGKVGVSTSTPTKSLSVTGDTLTTGTTTTGTLDVASSSVKVNGINYQAPSVQGYSGSALITDGSNNLSWGLPGNNQVVMASTTAGSLSAAGTLTSASAEVSNTASTTVTWNGMFECKNGGSGGSCTFTIGDTQGDTFKSYSLTPAASGTCDMEFHSVLTAISTTSAYLSNNFYAIPGGGTDCGTTIVQTVSSVTLTPVAGKLDFNMTFAISGGTSQTGHVYGVLIKANP